MAALPAAAAAPKGRATRHAVAGAAPGPLGNWAASLPAAPGFLWWELAAGACSSVAAHALVAAAADPGTTREQAELIDDAYFPPLGALTVLLDDLVDREADLVAGEHNYLGYCASNEQAAARIGLLADRAKAALAPLPHARRHRVFLAGVASFYLSEIASARDAVPSGGEYAGPIRERLLESLEPNVRLVLTAMRLRHD